MQARKAGLFQSKAETVTSALARPPEITASNREMPLSLQDATGVTEATCDQSQPFGSSKPGGRASPGSP